MKKIVIAGGTGFLGRALTEYYLNKGFEVIILSRSKATSYGKIHFVQWDGKTKGDWANHLDGADFLINLCGKSVDCRYNEKNKKTILTSRVESTIVLGEAMKDLAVPPKIWVNASSATIYPHSQGESMTEQSELGTGFSVDVCKKWEEAFFKIETIGTRKIAIRSSMVFANDGSVYRTLKKLTKRGIGGTQGSGEQYISWIHIKDFLNAVDFILHNESINGIVNICSPDPRPNKEFNQLLRRSLDVKFHFPVTTWMVKLGAVFLRTEAELVLKSRKVIPELLLQRGFTFEFRNLEKAFEDLNSKT